MEEERKLRLEDTEMKERKRGKRRSLCGEGRKEKRGGRKKSMVYREDSKGN